MTYVRFSKKRTWHLAIEIGQHKGGAQYIVTGCGSPSLATQEEDTPVAVIFRSNVHPARFCRRCEPIGGTK